MISNVQQIAQEIGAKIKNLGCTRKFKWEKQVKEKNRKANRRKSKTENEK